MHKSNIHGVFTLTALGLAAACGGTGTSASNANAVTSHADGAPASLDAAATPYAFLSSDSVNFREDGSASGEVLVLTSNANFCGAKGVDGAKEGATTIKIFSPALVDGLKKFSAFDLSSTTRYYQVEKRAYAEFGLTGYVCTAANPAGFGVGLGSYTVSTSGSGMAVDANIVYNGATTKYHLSVSACPTDSNPDSLPIYYSEAKGPQPIPCLGEPAPKAAS